MGETPPTNVDHQPCKACGVCHLRGPLNVLVSRCFSLKAKPVSGDDAALPQDFPPHQDKSAYKAVLSVLPIDEGSKSVGVDFRNQVIQFAANAGYSTKATAAKWADTISYFLMDVLKAVPFEDGLPEGTPESDGRSVMAVAEALFARLLLGSRGAVAHGCCVQLILGNGGVWQA